MVIGPVCGYLFFGDLIARARKGEDVIDRKTFKETMQAVTGMQMGKAGFGLYAMDKLVDDIGNIFEGQDSDAAYYAIKKNNKTVVGLIKKNTRETNHYFLKKKKGKKERKRKEEEREDQL